VTAEPPNLTRERNPIQLFPDRPWADGIVKNMLLDARGSGGERREVDLNATVEEALNLAYHGARAEKPGFTITLERNFDPAVGTLEIYPQELTRVMLNLFSNGFYAATRKARDAAGPDFQPTLTVATEARPDAVVIRVRDNGTGIPDNARRGCSNPSLPPSLPGRVPASASPSATTSL
jgi:signal transduction histidine kinase